MKISNGERVHYNKAIVVPMPEDVVEKVHQLTKQRQNLKERLEFCNRKRQIVYNDANDNRNTNSNITGVSETNL